MNKTLTGQATAEQIEAWKKEHGKVFTYEVDGKICYMRSVDRNLYALAASKIAQAGPAKFNETVINGIWLGGCDDIRKEDCYFFGLVELVEDLMGKKKGSLGEC